MNWSTYSNILREISMHLGYRIIHSPRLRLRRQLITMTPSYQARNSIYGRKGIYMIIFSVRWRLWTNDDFEATLRWRRNGRDSVSNHQPHDCLLNRLFRRRSKKTSKLRVTGLCAGNSPGTGEFPAQMASNAENVSIWWRHHEIVHGRRPPKVFLPEAK